MENEKVEPKNEIAEYNATRAGLADIAKRMKGVVYDLTTTGGMEAAKLDRRELISLRTGLETMRVVEKAPVLKRGKAIDAEAKLIEIEIRKLEEPIDKQIKAVELKAKEEKEKLLNEKREKTRLIMERIEKLRNLPTMLEHHPAEKLAEAIKLVEATPVDEENFGDYLDLAVEVYDVAFPALQKLHAFKMQEEKEAADKQIEDDRVAEEKRLEQVAEDKRLQDDRDKLDAERKEFDDNQAETKRIQEIKDYIEAIYGAAKIGFAQNAGEQNTPGEIQAMINSLDDICTKVTFGEFVDTANARRQTLRDLYVTAHQVAEERVAADTKAQDDADAETKRLADKAAEDEIERKRLAKEKKKSDRAARVAEAKCVSAGEAFQKILNIVNSEEIGDETKLDEIQVIAEANI